MIEIPLTSWLELPDDDWQSNTVHIYCIDRRSIPLAHATLREWLSASERARLDSIRNKTVQERIAHSRGMLRALLAHYLKMRPVEVPIKQQDQGKPYLPDQQLEFSVSHSGPWLLIAISESTAIGVDVEKITTQRNHQQIAQRKFTEKELQSLNDSTIGAVTAFYRIWSRKEALIKAAEMPLWQGLAEFEVCPKSADQICFTAKAEPLRLRNLKIDSEHEAAIAWQGSDEMQIHQFWAQALKP